MKISYTTSQEKELITKFRELVAKQGENHNDVLSSLIRKWINSFSDDKDVI